MTPVQWRPALTPQGPKDIAHEICQEYGMTLEELNARGRLAEWVEVRKLICDQLAIRGYHPRTIAAVLHRHRTTVLHHLGRA